MVLLTARFPDSGLSLQYYQSSTGLFLPFMLRTDLSDEALLIINKKVVVALNRIQAVAPRVDAPVVEVVGVRVADTEHPPPVQGNCGVGF